MKAILSENKDADFIDSYIAGSQSDLNQGWQLGREMALLSEADKVIFSHGWRDDKGCRILFEFAKEFNYDVIE